MRDPVRRRLALTIERIVQRTPELSSPRYLPTFWAAGMWPNLALLMIKQVMVMKVMMIMMMIVIMIMMVEAGCQLQKQLPESLAAGGGRRHGLRGLAGGRRG